MSSKLAPTPKVAAAAIGGIIASALLANITLITPDLFDGLGKFSSLVYGLTITLVMFAAGWLKSEGSTAAQDETATAAEAPVTAPAAPVEVHAPATVFPAAKVEAAAVEPVAVTPVFEAPAAPVA
ncbi:hypothetical protein ACFFGR_09085 [Arthrobacter liuii]|uniref:Uncharacterized protein n=1 Tax=Arthrobacter liuii TaxID=1476996 RepID=A0ABQ2AMG0_9MICC|nr:hypothetical protein [Arthrobacter liuii]GGH93694.1 hypothetical protein GCM10007170_15160 [Arthrobacter liuii]